MKEAEESRTNWLYILVGLLIGIAILGVSLWLHATRVGAFDHYYPLQNNPPLCKSQNAECSINESEHPCCAGLVCVPFNRHSNNGKCHPAPTPPVSPLPTLTPTPTQTPNPTPTPTPTETPCKEDCEPTPTPETTPAPTGEPHRDVWTTAEVPACTDTAPEKSPCNFTVWRKGDQAKLTWEICGSNAGDKVNIYYKNNNSNDWQYSLTGVPNNGLAEVNGLGTMDVSFAMQFVNGCNTGSLASPMTNTVVDGATHGWVMFR